MRAWQILRAGWRAYRTWPNGAVLRAQIQALGGIWPKVGQLLSLRRDLFPAAFCDALTPLLGEQTAHGIQASVGIVRREGDRAIKTLRPDVVALVGQDVRILRRFAKCLAFMPVAHRARPREFAREVAQVMAEETDLRFEAYRQHRMRKILKDHDGIYVPKVYLADCTADRLVTEWIEGDVLGDVLALPAGKRIAHLSRLGFDGKRLVRRTLLSLLRSVLEDNLFHGDLHPRNILLRKREIVFIDFGTIGSTEGDFLARFTAFVRALTRRHFARAAQLFCLLCQGLQSRFVWAWWPNRRLMRLRACLVQTMHRWADRAIVTALPYVERSINTLTQALMMEVLKAKGTLEWAWFRIQRALSTPEAMVASLWPSINWLTLADRYLRDAEKRVSLQPFSPFAVINRLVEVLDRVDDCSRLSLADLLIAGQARGL